MKKVITQRHQYNVKNVLAYPDLMMTMLSGNIKYIFSRFQLYVRTGVYAYMDATLLKKSFSWDREISSTFNVLADFDIKVFGLKFVIMKFFFKVKSLTRKNFEISLIVQFRVRYDRWIKEVKTHFLQG